ncbi:MAG: hypothetical protein QOD92_2057 [Acidimicrobiaceae bacterium]|jgi:hypothetical protein
MTIDSNRSVDEDDLPDAALFWRWVGKATRPVVGWVLLAIAALVILIGWYGISGESNPAKQLPYLVSAGVLGVVLAVVGAYFLGTEELRRDSGRLDRLERMVNELHVTLLAREDAPPPVKATPSTTSPNGGVYVILTGSDTYHRPECAMVASKPNTSMLAASSIERRQLTPCALCEPSLVDAP